MSELRDREWGEGWFGWRRRLQGFYSFTGVLWPCLRRCCCSGDALQQFGNTVIRLEDTSLQMTVWSCGFGRNGEQCIVLCSFLIWEITEGLVGNLWRSQRPSVNSVYAQKLTDISKKVETCPVFWTGNARRGFYKGLTITRTEIRRAYIRESNSGKRGDEGSG